MLTTVRCGRHRLHPENWAFQDRGVPRSVPTAKRPNRWSPRYPVPRALPSPSASPAHPPGASSPADRASSRPCHHRHRRRKPLLTADLLITGRSSGYSSSRATTCVAPGLDQEVFRCSPDYQQLTSSRLPRADVRKLSGVTAARAAGFWLGVNRAGLPAGSSSRPGSGRRSCREAPPARLLCGSEALPRCGPR